MHMAQLMPLPLTVSCFSKIKIGFTFLVPAHQGSPGQTGVCVLLMVLPLVSQCEYTMGSYTAETIAEATVSTNYTCLHALILQYHTQYTICRWLGAFIN